MRLTFEDLPNVHASSCLSLPVQDILRKMGNNPITKGPATCSSRPRFIPNMLSHIFRWDSVVFLDRTQMARTHHISHPGPIEVMFPDQIQIGEHADALKAHFGLSRGEIEGRYNRCCHAVLALHRGLPVSILWMAFSSVTVPQVGQTLRLRSQEFACFDARTIPRWRGLGICTRLNDLAFSAAQAAGRSRQITWMSSSNRAARRVAEKLDLDPVGHGTAYWLFNKCRHLDMEWHTPGICQLGPD